VVVIGHLVPMAPEGVHKIHNIVMGMAVVFDLCLMLGHDLCDLEQIMRLGLRVRRQNHPHRQSDGDCKAQEYYRLSYHLPVSAGLGPLALSPWGGYLQIMTQHIHHATHPDIVKRLKRANGHLLSVIGMIEAQRPCTDIAQQLHAVEKAITQAKRTLIQDHIDHCLDAALAGAGSDGTPATAEFKAITKYL